MEKLTFTMESYLDTIYELSGDGGESRLKDIAAKMGVAKSTANAAMYTLAERGLIQNERYQHIRLTESGIAAARDIVEKHETIRRFFCDVLNVDEETADTDACAIEHMISRQAVVAMQVHLANGYRG